MVSIQVYYIIESSIHANGREESYCDSSLLDYSKFDFKLATTIKMQSSLIERKAIVIYLHLIHSASDFKLATTIKMKSSL